VKEGTAKAAAVARAGLGTICDLCNNDRKHLFGLFGSGEALIETCAAIIEDDLDLKASTLMREGDDF
jgi:hypothetical protein